jgi:Glycosyl transferases group 1
VVRLANAIAPHSGGLRTALRELGAGYARAGHDPVLIMPGLRAADEQTEQGRVITVPGPLVPGTGGYRVITARRSLKRLLEDLEPDRLEVSDRTTLRWTGEWAAENGVRSMMVSHEGLAGLLQLFVPPGLPSQRLADRMNRASADSYDLLARLLATADVAIAPGPVETFGLAALEALASGTPVVVCRESALPEVTGCAGLAADDDAVSYADAVERLLARDTERRRHAAREQATRFDWQTAVDGFLRAHGTSADGRHPR